MNLLKNLINKLDKKQIKKIVIRLVAVIYVLVVTSIVTKYSSNILLPDLFDNERVTVDAFLFISILVFGVYLFIRETNIVKYLFVYNFVMIFIVFTTLISYDSRPIILLPLLLSLFYDKTTGLLGAVSISAYNVFTFVDRPDYLVSGPEFMIVIIVLILAAFSALIINKKLFLEIPFYPVVYFLSLWLYQKFGSYCQDYPNCEIYCSPDFKFFASKGVIISIGIYFLVRVFYYCYENKVFIKKKLQEISSEEYVLVMEMKKNSSVLYNHSVEIAELAEKAAKAISVDADIAFAGGLYHDVGKLAGNNYIHEGVKIANKYKMPIAIKNIIIEHNVKNRLPRTKEAAIVMLADTAVSAVEYLRNNNKKNVDETVVFENALMTRLKNGTLNNSGLSISEFNKIKETFMNYKNFNIQ